MADPISIMHSDSTLNTFDLLWQIDVLHFLPPNYDVLCSISKLPISFWNIVNASHSKLSKELTNRIILNVGQALFELLIQTTYFDCSDP